MEKHDTREGWLTSAMRAIEKKIFNDAGYDLPKMRVSCGFPKATTARAIGQCWDTKVSADETYEMFISPTLGNPVEILATLLHEMIHACVGIDEGHKGAFRKLAKEFGLEGKMTATYAAEETELCFYLTILGDRLGSYPGAVMKPVPKEKGKGGSGWVRLQSPENSIFKVVISPKFVEEFGVPKDPWGNDMVPVEVEGGE